jgi:hypothetical protein
MCTRGEHHRQRKTGDLSALFFVKEQNGRLFPRNYGCDDNAIVIAPSLRAD